MHTETERIFGTLQVLVEPYLTVRLPGHEDGGTIVPFVWDVSEQGEFNIINLCLANGWLGTISLEGDFGGGYYYSYDHQIVYGVALSKELAFEQAFQKARLLELKQFHSFYTDKNYLSDYYEEDYEEVYAKYERVNKFFNQRFTEVIMYRFSFFTQEHIYIIGQSNPGDWVGLYLKSEFVYNP